MWLLLFFSASEAMEFCVKMEFPGAWDLRHYHEQNCLLMCIKLQTFIVTGHGDVHVVGYGSRT